MKNTNAKGDAPARESSHPLVRMITSIADLIGSKPKNYANPVAAISQFSTHLRSSNPVASEILSDVARDLQRDLSAGPLLHFRVSTHLLKRS